MKIEIPDDKGEKVISLSVVRDSYEARRWKKKCEHMHTTLDTEFSTLTCDDCKRELNPIEFLVKLVERWRYVTQMTLKYNKAKADYETKIRTKCEHCGKVTRINPPRKLRVVRAATTTHTEETNNE